MAHEQREYYLLTYIIINIKVHYACNVMRISCLLAVYTGFDDSIFGCERKATTKLLHDRNVCTVHWETGKSNMLPMMAVASNHRKFAQNG